MKKFSKLILIIAPIILFAFLIPRLIVIRQISCSNQFGSCSESLQKKLRLIEGNNLVRAKLNVESILSKEVLVSSYTQRLKLPFGIEVKVIERIPAIAVTRKNLDSFGLVDKGGYIIGFQRETDLPVLKIDENIPGLGERISAEVYFAAKLFLEIHDLYSVYVGETKSQSLEVVVQNIKIIFPLEGDRDALLGSLGLILSGLKTNDKTSKIEEVDLRFKNPVVR